jgi:hypothetical protein
MVTSVNKPACLIVIIIIIIIIINGSTAHCWTLGGFSVS